MNEEAGGAGPEHAAIAALSGARFFDGVPLDVLSRLAAEAQTIQIGAGEILFRQGDQSSDLFIVRSGALTVVRDEPDGTRTRVGDAFSGETVGEMAMLTGDPRVANVVAARDSELLRISRAAIGAVVARDPSVGLAIARVLARRLANAQNARRPIARPRVFALLPHATLDRERAAFFIENLAVAMSLHGAVAAIDRRDAHRSRAWFQQAEAKHDYLLFVGDPADSGWSLFCARQADLPLFIADGDSPASASPGWEDAGPRQSGDDVRRELVLLGDPAREPLGARAWRDVVAHDFVHHVREDRDVARVARLMTRHAVTLVLSGGGARGFAHLGVVDALMEAGVEIDVYGGSSMGGIIAAAYAGGWPRDVARMRMRASFVETRPLSDPVVPVVALFRGRKVAWLLEQAFGERHIEDLRHPYFCVSSSLTRAAPMMHRDGLLRRWLQASVSIPGVLPPVLERGEVHVDGGIMDNLPIAAAHSLGRGPVIGVDVSGDERFDQPGPATAAPAWQRWFGGREDGAPTITETLWRVGTLGSASTVRRDQDAATLVIRPPVGSIGLLDWKQFDQAIAIGYEHTRALLRDNPALLAGLRAPQ